MTSKEAQPAMAPMNVPSRVRAIEQDPQSISFGMASDYLTGQLLCALAASKPAGKLLELGTGTGLASAWLLEGMSQDAHLISIDNNPLNTAVAAKHLVDARYELHTGDAMALLESLSAQEKTFDLIFADTWPGKIDKPELALSLLHEGGIYIIDDMDNRYKERLEPVAGIPDEVLQRIPQQVRDLSNYLKARQDLDCAELPYSTGIMLCVKNTRKDT